MWLLGVVSRRYIYFLILLIVTPLVSVLFGSSIPSYYFKMRYSVTIISIQAFVMYCVNGTSCSSLLIESTDSMITGTMNNNIIYIN